MRIMTIFMCVAVGVVVWFAVAVVSRAQNVKGTLEMRGEDIVKERPEGYPVATFAGGCFWCLESEFRALDGVLYTRSGYAGGAIDNPTYQDITTGQTGHAEAVEVYYDPDQVTYEALVTFFLTKAHDPTQLNRQGVDVGTQYRSEIFYHDEVQKDVAERMIGNVNARGVWSNPIVTTVNAAPVFWVAEEYHQQYYEKYEEKTGKIHQRVVYKRMMKK